MKETLVKIIEDYKNPNESRNAVRALLSKNGINPEVILRFMDKEKVPNIIMTDEKWLRIVSALVHKLLPEDEEVYGLGEWDIIMGDKVEPFIEYWESPHKLTQNLHEQKNKKPKLLKSYDTNK